MLIVRRVIVCLVVSAIIWNSGGYYVCFRALQAGIREEIKREARKIDEKDLVPIEIADQDISGISWVKKDKEFIFKEELYDVVRIERSEDSNIYYCIRDIREKQLITDYNRTSQKDKDLDLIATIILKLTTPVSIIQLTPEPALYISGYLTFGNHYYILRKGFDTILTPPPDLNTQKSDS